MRFLFFVLCLLFTSCSPSYSEQEIKEFFSSELPEDAIIIKVYNQNTVKFKLDNECFLALYGYMNGITKIDCEK